MRPWQHAVASAVQASDRTPSGEQDWAPFLALHEFLDLSKAGCADRRHRIMLHHCDMGTAIARRAFPKLAHCERLVEQHVEEDIGFAALLGDWLAAVDFDRLPRPVMRRIGNGPDGVARMVINQAIGARHLDDVDRDFQVEAALDVARFLWMPLAFASDASPPVLSLLMNSVGPSLIRAVYGPPQVTVRGGRRSTVDWAWLAEAVIMASFGRIPDYTEVVCCVTAEPRRLAKAS